VVATDAGSGIDRVASATKELGRAVQGLAFFVAACRFEDLLGALVADDGGERQGNVMQAGGALLHAADGEHASLAA
jgi:hypothetical protein